MLRFAILELLERRPLSGYELKKRFGGSIVFFWEASHSQIYPELKRMEADGLVVGNRVAHAWRPTKKVYSVTARGREELRAWLREPAGLQAVKDEMMLKCFAFNLISAGEAASQLRRHQALHEGRLEVYRGIKRQLEQRHGELLETRDPVLFWNSLTLHHAIAHERMYIQWCKWALGRQRSLLRRGRSGAAAGAGEGRGKAAGR